MNRTPTSPLQILDNLDRFFSSTVQTAPNTPNAHRVYQSDSGIRLEIDLPGFAKEDLNLKRESRKLTVSSKESSERKFSREFKLGADYNLEKIEAKLKHGLLRIDIPRHQELSNIQEIEIH